MQSGLMTEATRCLSLSEAGTRKHMRTPQPHDLYRSRFHYGLEWEILNADAVVLLGLTHALRYGAILLIFTFNEPLSLSQRIVHGISSVHVSGSSQ